MTNRTNPPCTAWKTVATIAVLAVILAAIACAPGNYRWDQTLNPGHKAGFWAGVWHGLIIIVTFIVSLFTGTVGIYESNNVGWPYNLGFILGLCFSVFAPWRITKHKVKKVKCDD